jgi:hypothetical protein
MDNFKIIFNEWQKEMTLLRNEPFRVKMESGQVTLAEIKGAWRETYFYAGINPHIYQEKSGR